MGPDFTSWTAPQWMTQWYGLQGFHPETSPKTACGLAPWLGTWYPRSFQRYPTDLAKCNPSLSATQSDSWDARLDTSSTKKLAPFRGERKTKSQRKHCQDHRDQDMHTSHIWHIVSCSLEKSNSTRCIITIGYSFIDYQSTSRSAGD